MSDDSEYSDRVLESVRGELAHLEENIVELAMEEFKRGRSLHDIKMKYDPNIAINNSNSENDKGN